MASEVILGADIEQLLVDWLPARLVARGFTGPVGTKKATAVESVTLFLTGGVGRVTVISGQPQVTFDCRAATEARASALVLMVRALVFSAEGERLSGRQVYSVGELAHPTNLPDPNFTGSRYRWSAFIHIRSTVL